MTLRSIFAVLAISTLAGCAVNADRSDAEGDVDGDEAAAAAKNPAYTFYRVRQDFRKCMFPMCGGVWYRQVNLAKTNCIGGGSADWCYAAESDFTAARSPELETQALADTAIVRATIGKKTINGDRWATFNVYEGYKAITDAAPTETFASVDPRFYLVKDNGIRCITTPCYSTDASRLNTSFKTTLSGVDLSGITGADADQLDAVSGIMVNTGVVLFGTITGRTIKATQAYLKVSADPNYCTDISQCTLSTYTRPVAKKSDCYCPMCPQAMTAADATANAAGFAKFCAATSSSCPLPVCARPPSVGCVENRCQYAGLDL